MRPLPVNDAWIGRQRPADYDSATLRASASNNHMSFFLADESSVESHIEHGASASVPAHHKDSRKLVDAAAHVLASRRDDRDHASRQSERDYASSYSPSSRASVMTYSPASLPSQAHPHGSRPMTPIMLGPSCSASAMSSPSSRRNSLVGSISEHAVTSDEDDDMLLPEPSGMLHSGVAPQLVMPSIKMPSRRPFTDSGKNMGRLKVLLAGDSGVGKTSLVKAIVQTCEHIVHVDPISSQVEPAQGPSKSKPNTDLSRIGSNSTIGITEIYASTKPYPEWWSDLDEFRATHRRKSMGDSVLERNICFVDTPGYGHGSSAMEGIVSCVEYVESHLNKVTSDNLSDSDMMTMLGGDGGCQVDVVLYLISQRLKPADLEYIRRLVPLTNVIPVLSRADSLSPEQLAACKREVAGQLREANIRPFSFTPSSPGSATSMPAVPYTASSANVSDYDIMDASLLMSPDYVQPLITTELGFLVENVFSPNGASWLRHAAAKKYLIWRDTMVSRPRHLYRPLTFPGPEPSSMLAHQSSNQIGPSTSLALARVTDLGQENDAPRLHVVDWAADLQRSLASERSRYEALARGERAVWLTERLSECLRDGTLVAVNEPRETTGGRRRRGDRHGLSRRTKQHQDPLGLLQVTADLKARGWLALELLGSLSVMGGVAFCLSRLDWRMEPVELAEEWAKFWGMDI
ncbi:Septin-domain-containing protein [Biscogniauxia sp. FL1348]|nr:Septin-domain-containing protein [Biscogniauxia sp. FL1348]